MSGQPHDFVSGPCPFCHREGGTIVADFDGAESGGVPSLLHSVPTCETYDRLSGDEFVRAVIERRHYQ